MAWYNANWQYRVKVTVLSSKVSADETDYPVYVDLSDLPAGFFTNVKSDGSDIRVTTSDETTECPIEVVSITTGSSIGELHFKAPSISSSTNTDFYIYYGYASATAYAEGDTYGKHNVWSNNYQLVLHFSEASGNLIDSTSNSNDVTMSGSPAYAQTGKVGEAMDFEAGNPDTGVNTSPTNLLIAGDVTIETWIKSESVGTAILGIVYLDGASETEADNVQWSLFTRTDGDISFYHENGTGTNNIVDTIDTGYITDGTWKHVVAMRKVSSKEVRFSVGGSHAETGNYSNDPTGGTTSDLTLGKDGVASVKMDGLLDELRVSNVDRGDSYATTVYNNQNDPSTFYSVGSQETDTGGGATPVILPYLTLNKFFGG